jgi:hypothetical protein
MPVLRRRSREISAHYRRRLFGQLTGEDRPIAGLKCYLTPPHVEHCSDLAGVIKPAESYIH